MSELSKPEKDHVQKKNKLHEAEASIFLDILLHDDTMKESGDYLLALGVNHRWGEAAVLRVRNRLWGNKFYQFGLFPRGRDHEVFMATRSMKPICSVPWGFEKCVVYPGASGYSNEVDEWIKAGQRKSHAAHN